MVACPACGHENREAARFCDACGSPLAPRAPERRKPATLLFCDLSGSTAMGERVDAESVRELMFRYFHEMRSAIERHGGTVEKFAGDAVMAAFGVPVAHEDDALRACRAAVEMRARLHELNVELERRFGQRLECRIGIQSGQVVAGDPVSGETFVTGDPVNVAARLEQAADAGEILIGEDTYRLVAQMVEAEAVPPVAAKGKAEPVTAYRLLSTAGLGVPRRRLGGLLVGREEELDALEREFRRAVADRRCRLATVAGEPGIGKSRLARELEARIGDRARVLRGRCLPYGEGITFWPIAEIVRQAAGILDEDTREQAVDRVRGLVADDADSQVVAARVAEAIGLAAGGGSAEETAWAIRRLLAAIALPRPALVVVDDVQWAEPALRELLRSLPERVSEPLLVLCLARTELLDEEPDWPGVFPLAELSSPDAAALMETLLPEELDAAAREQLLARSGGNPLFLEELVALVREGGSGEALPGTLGALLAARLDRLAAPERSALERGSVEGEVFHRGAVAALSPEAEHAAAAERLRALAERGLVHSAGATFRGEAAFRFHHLLLRDAVYDSTAKRLRAELHERFAGWLEDVAGDRLAEYEEIVGYHLEQAYRYREQLGPVDKTGRALAGRASERLFAAGRRAADRGDVAAAASLLQRSTALTDEDAPQRSARLLLLGDVLFTTGELERMDETYLQAQELARRHGDPVREVAARLNRIKFAVERHADGFTNDDVRAVAEEALQVFEAAGDHVRLADAWMALGDFHRVRDEVSAWSRAYEQALEHARLGGDRRQLGLALARFGGPLTFGPTPVDEVIALMKRELADPDFPVQARGVWTAMLGELHALRGDVEHGRQLCRRGRALLEEIGMPIAIAVVTAAAVAVEELACDWQAAEELARTAVRRLEAIGHGGADSYRLEVALLAARQGRLDEAEQLVAASEGSSDPEERLIRAWILAARGRDAEAEPLARAAVDELSRSEAPGMRARAHELLADVLAAAGRRAEAVANLQEAARAWDSKGATFPATRARARAGELAG